MLIRKKYSLVARFLAKHQVKYFTLDDHPMKKPKNDTYKDQGESKTDSDTSCSLPSMPDTDDSQEWKAYDEQASKVKSRLLSSFNSDELVL